MKALKMFGIGMAVLVSSLVASPVAGAQTGESGPAVGAQRCSTPGPQSNGTMTTWVVSPSGDSCAVLRMIAALSGQGPSNQTGFFRFFGPRGHIADTQTKWWTFGESARQEVNQSAWDGSLWCAEFWMQTGSTFTRSASPACGEF